MILLRLDALCVAAARKKIPDTKSGKPEAELVSVTDSAQLKTMFRNMGAKPAKPPVRPKKKK